MEENAIQLDAFLSFTIGILVYFVGMHLNGRVQALRDYNIPEPVTGGIIASLAALVFFVLSNQSIEFNLSARDLLLVYFFTTIGINARVADLLQGGRPLLILLVLTLAYIVLQDIIGVAVAQVLGQPVAIGILAGSASLIGGHGTAIAWAPEIAADHGVPNALEIGVAAATLGLVMASLMGGPIAKYLMTYHNVADADPDGNIVGIPYEEEHVEQINHVSIMGVILLIHVIMILGYSLNEALLAAGFKLPFFVSCLMVGVLFSNTIPYALPRIHWPARTRALALISDFSLGIFIAMSLMSMQLWAVAELAGPLLFLLAAQAGATVLFILFVLFPLMGRNYMATVLSAGFAGFSLGATPTAVANMTAVTKKHGPSPQAMIVLPLVGAFFVDITNAFVIRFFLSL